MLRRIALSLAFVVMMTAQPSHAQYFDGPAYAFPVTDMIGPAITGTSMNSYIKGRQPAPRRKETAPPKPAALADLRVGRDPAVSAAVKAAFRNQLVRSNPARRAAIDQALARDWLVGYRDEIASPNGLDSANLADAVTGYAIAAWAIANKQTTISPRAITAVRDTMRQSMRASPQTARLTAAARQKMAEELIHQTVLIMANRTEIARTRNGTLAESAARHYRSAALSGMGVDLAKLQLTDRGFASR